MEGIEKVMMNVEGKFWTRQNEMVEELESLGYEVAEVSGDSLVVIDLQDEEETEHTLRIGHANRTMWIVSAE